MYIKIQLLYCVATLLSDIKMHEVGFNLNHFKWIIEDLLKVKRTEVLHMINCILTRNQQQKVEIKTFISLLTSI